MLGAAVLAGAAVMGTARADAAVVRFGVAVGAPVAYVPPCPGPGYVWVAGYRGYPGRWNFVGPRRGVIVDRFYGGRDFYRGRAFDRGFSHDRFRR
jgi:hypothetical protein